MRRQTVEAMELAEKGKRRIQYERETITGSMEKTEAHDCDRDVSEVAKQKKNERGKEGRREHQRRVSTPPPRSVRGNSSCSQSLRMESNIRAKQELV